MARSASMAGGLAFLLATTAQAQDSLAVARDNELWAGQQLVAQRSLAIELETNARLAQVETERRLSQVTLVQPIDPPVDLERDDTPNPKLRVAAEKRR